MFKDISRRDFKDCTNIFSLIFFIVLQFEKLPPAVDPKIKRTVNPCRKNNSKVKIFSFDNHFY